MKQIIKAIIPKRILYFLINTYLKLRKIFIYSNYNSNEYWKNRALAPGQAAVLWTNEEYNNLYRKNQKKIIEKYILNLPSNAKVLDIGCGIGVVSKMIANIKKDIKIDAVDFSEMISIAKKEICNHQINFIASSAETYFCGYNHYDLIISSGCYSAIRDINALETAIINGIKMTKKGGIILMIDPFHRTKYLARARYSSNQVIKLITENSFSLIEKSGILFFPYREKLANSNIYGEKLEKKFKRGEKLLNLLGKHTWADYKILIFKKN